MSIQISFSYIALIFATLLLSCKGVVDHAGPSTQDDLTPKRIGERKTIDFVKNYKGEENRLFAFVGQKISLEYLPYEVESINTGFKAKYKVLQKVFGDFSEDTIEFVANDHHGMPGFAKFNNVLLFVSSDGGTYYHQTYMFNDVYLTKEGRWAGTYAQHDFQHQYNKNTQVKPVPIDFANEVSYPIESLGSDGQRVAANYPSPYFKVSGDKAIAVYGNYVEELFILKRDGYLTARGIFKDGKLVE